MIKDKVLKVCCSGSLHAKYNYIEEKERGFYSTEEKDMKPAKLRNCQTIINVDLHALHTFMYVHLM